MPELKELNDKESLAEQMQSGEEGPIVLINIFTVDPAEEKGLMEARKHDADFMKQQPGYISTQLHKGINGSSTFVNYAVWESVESFRNAFTNPEFQSRIKNYLSSAVVSLHLFKKLAGSGHCIS